MMGYSGMVKLGEHVGMEGREESGGVVEHGGDSET